MTPSIDPTAPVTVSITRHIEPDHTDQMIAWMRAGTSLAERFPGFLGTGWVRPAVDSDRWHMLYRFADAESLAQWEASTQRTWWLNSAQGLVNDSRVEMRTGIEGWFDPPTGYDAKDLRTATGPPPRWKQSVAIFVAFFPLSLLLGYLANELIPDLPLVVRTLATTLIATPLMTYLLLPWITARLDWWLHGRPAPWRR